VSLEGK